MEDYNDVMWDVITKLYETVELMPKRVSTVRHWALHVLEQMPVSYPHLIASTRNAS